MLKAVSQTSKIESEQDWITAAQSGDKVAFKKLYEMHVNRVYALCFRLCADKSLAEDATQEVFIQLWNKLDNFKGDSLFSTWLHSVTSNVTISYIRKQRGWWQKMLNIDDTKVVDIHHFEQTSELETDIEGLEKHIYRLPERARWVFVLHAVEGYRHEEIGQILGMAVGSSKAQYHRARKLLQEWITNE